MQAAAAAEQASTTSESDKNEGRREVFAVRREAGACREGRGEAKASEASRSSRQGLSSMRWRLITLNLVRAARSAQEPWGHACCLLPSSLHENKLQGLE